MPLNTPFDYANILIGNEIISRGLKQQDAYANARPVEYGMTWNQNDVTRQAQAILDATAMRNSSFTVPSSLQGCLIDPPCPWDKSGGHDLSATDLMPIIMANDGTTTYDIKVFEQIGSPSGNYIEGSLLADYDPDPLQLDPSIRSRFMYYAYSGKITYTGKTILVIEKNQPRVATIKFTYLFNLI